MKKLILSICLVAASSAVFGQDGGAGYSDLLDGQMEALKQKNILSEEQFAKFDAIYRDYNAGKKEIKRQNRELNKQSRELEDEAAVRAKLDSVYMNKQKLADMEQEYYSDMMKTVSAKQFVQIRQAMRQYRKQVLKAYSASKEQPSEPAQGPEAQKK